MSKNIFEKVNVTEMPIDEIEKLIDKCPNQMSMDELEKACDAANTEPYEGWPNESFEEYMKTNEERLFEEYCNEHGFINKLYGKCSNIVNELTSAWRRFPLILTLTYICGEIFSCYTFIVAAAKIFAPNGKISKYYFSCQSQ